jgi:hypothetical protein
MVNAPLNQNHPVTAGALTAGEHHRATRHDRAWTSFVGEAS